MTKKYIDATVFLTALLYENESSKACKEFLLKVTQQQISACTSILTWDELVYVLRKHINKELAVAQSEKFLRMPGLELIPADLDVIYKAHELVSNYSLNPRDSIHAATAIINGCKEIASDDSDFDAVKELKRIKI